ncbi:hypothetical protein BE21_49815 [Sorangium cellulosum]|uniref:Uncharacterized protein n=1 Tax=Sorangium cellulosum TaxID=56 RepID=A0A150TGM2_SORCE|nr:hypothetical protein BE21_49815 [Sorangium cellulosum]
METEDAVLSWNHVPILLNYKYDMSTLIDDLVPLLKSLLSADEGHTLVKWGSDTFLAHWDVRWSKGVVSIDARWSEVSGGYKELLNERGKVELPLASFVAEWRGVLAVIADAIERSGVELDDDSTLRDLRSVVAASGQRGRLYA